MEVWHFFLAGNCILNSTKPFFSLPMPRDLSLGEGPLCSPFVKWLWKWGCHYSSKGSLSQACCRFYAGKKVTLLYLFIFIVQLQLSHLLPPCSPLPAATYPHSQPSWARVSRPDSGVLGEDSTSLVLEDFEEMSGSESVMDYRSDGEYMRWGEN